jgi:hypothetical protein
VAGLVVQSHRLGAVLRSGLFYFGVPLISCLTTSEYFCILLYMNKNTKETTIRVKMGLPEYQKMLKYARFQFRTFHSLAKEVLTKYARSLGD